MLVPVLIFMLFPHANCLHLISASVSLCVRWSPALPDHGPRARFAAPKSTSKANQTTHTRAYASYRRTHAHLKYLYSDTFKPFKQPKAAHLDPRPPVAATAGRYLRTIPCTHNLSSSCSLVALSPSPPPPSSARLPYLPPASLIYFTRSSVYLPPHSCAARSCSRALPNFFLASEPQRAHESHRTPARQFSSIPHRSHICFSLLLFGIVLPARSLARCFPLSLACIVYATYSTFYYFFPESE